MEEFDRLLRLWKEQNQSGQDVTSTIIKLAEIIEKETEVFVEKNPDPFDYRSSCRFSESCIISRLLNILTKNHLLLEKIVKVYCQEDNLELNIASCRLLLDMLPEMDMLVYGEVAIICRFFQWAEHAPNPLRSYATGILAPAMHSQNTSGMYNEKNAYFVPLMLKRLHDLSEKHLKPKNVDENVLKSSPQTSKKRKLDEDMHDSPCSETKLKYPNSNLRVSPVPVNNLSDFPSPKGQFEQHYVIGFYQIFPFTAFVEQKLILDYLTSVCDHKNLLKLIVGGKTLPLILKYIDVDQNPDLRLALEALRCLSSLFRHKTIAAEFVNTGGLQLLLKVPFPSVAATGVSRCLHHLVVYGEIMEKICSTWSSLMPELISYALSLLQSFHNSSLWYISMFFETALQYQIILETFDHQDGLRKLFNTMSTLYMYDWEHQKILVNRRTTWHVCGALKSYFEAHLVLELHRQLSSSGRRDIFPIEKKPYESLDLFSERIDDCIQTWRELLSPNIAWKPVEKFMDLQGVHFLLQLINSNFRVGYLERADTNIRALVVLKVCSLTMPVQLLFCENVATTSSFQTTGVAVLLLCACDNYVSYCEMQRSALQTIINCLCTKIPQADSSKSTPENKLSIEEYLNKFYKCIKSRNGIIKLVNLLSIEEHHIEGDSIRALACQALSELARSETIKQIISKLPLIADGQLLDLMKKTVQQGNEKYHAQFCKYGFQLIERVTGAKVYSSSVSSMLDIYNSEVVACTKIVYNKAELYHLITEHLQSMGFHETVNTLKKEIIEKQICPMPAINSLVTSCKSNVIMPDPKPSSSRLQKPLNMHCVKILSLPVHHLTYLFLINVLNELETKDLNSLLKFQEKECMGNIVNPHILPKHLQFCWPTYVMRP
ncbi:hypothetical protein TNCT_145291 [Trichonephila clavata]|uniref:Uncharacterized protein n=1 Tax=Trichonephila clavata TaxID=2740835 RepID=A0A8X6KEV0_TRICU|nr:hypothetical protein TNCT_145291 [Trichonephila clavata]